MTCSNRARTTTRRIPRVLVGDPLVVFAVIPAALGYQALASSPSRTASPTEVPAGERPGPVGEADRALPEGMTVFDDGGCGCASPAPALLGALRQAATDAAADGVEFGVHRGWRSPEHREQLLHEAVSKYGSGEEAARRVADRSTSARDSADAAGVWPLDATAWPSEHRVDYGLCQTYSDQPSPRGARSRLPSHIQGCSDDQSARQGTGLNAIATPGGKP